MRTRNKTKSAEASAGFQNLLENLHNGTDSRSAEVKEPKSATLSDASRNDVGKLLKRVGAWRETGRKRQENSPAGSGSYSLGRKKHKPVGSGEDVLFYRRQSCEASISEIYSQSLPVCGIKSGMTLDTESRRKGKDENPSLERAELLESMTEGVTKITTSAEGCVNQEAHDGRPEKNMDEEVDWEDGNVASLEGCTYDHPNLWNGELTIKVGDESIKPDKKRLIRRATAKDKEFAELVHKAHLLCLIGRGKLIDAACNDPLIQASLLSLVPSHLWDLGKEQNLTANMFYPFVEWFRNVFHVRSPDEGSSHPEDGGTLTFKLAHAIESHAGTYEEVAALSVALLRALGVTTRYISVLDVTSLKPDVESLEASADWNSDSDSEDGSILPHLNTTKTTIASLEQIFARCSSQESPQNMKIEDHSPDFPERGGRGSKGRHHNTITSGKKIMEISHSQGQSGGTGQSPKPPVVGSAHSEAANGEDHAKAGSRRKGDLEFEMQLAMALAATATDAQRNACHENNAGFRDCHDRAHLDMTSGSTSVSVQGTKTSSCYARQNSTTVWSRKVGPPLHWAEVYCEGETLTGRWVHVDAVNGVVDGEQKVEAAAAACKRPLRYILAFAGNGAKDVTRRYVTKWSVITPQRVSPQWWEVTMHPLKELEAVATAKALDMKMSQKKCSQPLISVESEKHNSTHAIGQAEWGSQACDSSNDLGANEVLKYEGMHISLGTGHKSQVTDRSSLEDMELETRAFTEPLPTNQQAYKHHHLYVLERWLTKYQTLHPKGPVLGYCGGHPVYPRTCVQILHTAERWLREGLQVKKDECPAKVLKPSKNAVKGCLAESAFLGEDRGEGRTVELFGKWQTEQLQMPPAVDGIVPKNERGQVDAWSEKCLPPGTVHLRMPRLVPVAKRLGIDFAPAMVGFEVHNGRSVPIFEGIVICEEFRDVMLQAYAEEEERRAVEEQEKNEHLAISRWRQLLCSIVTRQRLHSAYEESSSNTGHLSAVPAVETIKFKADMSTDGVNALGQGRENMEQLSHNKKYPESIEKQNVDFSSMQEKTGHNHIHIFPRENQSYDAETTIWTKCCPCGFTIHVEEL